VNWRTAAVVVLLAVTAAAQEHQHAGAGGEKLGTVHFPISCTAAAQQAFDRGVALLHSFEFQRALDEFGRTSDADPSCGMAHWGVALARWSNPFAPGLRSAAQVQQGREAIDRARSAGAGTDRERAYIEAAARLYVDSDTVPQAARVAAYRDAMGALARRFPDDGEASMFYALSLAFGADPDDKTYADQLKAGAILERLFAAHPDHPGLAHYIIHTYDVPPLAGRALEAARRYATIAPSAPHALHMPSHTFTRVGYWQESIDANIAAAASAKAEGAVGEELHASDYQSYAYLQTARDRAARRLVDALPEMTARYDPTSLKGSAPPAAAYFAMAAIPARYALERGAWREAASLEAHPSPFAYADAITYFARALGSARIADVAAADRAVAVLDQLHDRLAREGEQYWTNQVDIQRRAAAAWIALAERRADAAVAGMRSAAEREDATEKAAVTPGPLAPARELLGDMLMALDRPVDALREYEATLTKEPNRFRALFGAGRAASRSGDRAAARRYFQQLVRVAARADTPPRPEIVEARRFVRR